ncbi:hypothetical protein E8E14_006578 [Neopestalotiopsis sp. 37M]|nr:hypothetical protein E8E14_006578 [Neopestalotiopsis sp. 37M]
MPFRWSEDNKFVETAVDSQNWVTVSEDKLLSYVYDRSNQSSSLVDVVRFCFHTKDHGNVAEGLAGFQAIFFEKVLIPVRKLHSEAEERHSRWPISDIWPGSWPDVAWVQSQSHPSPFEAVDGE